MNWIRWKWRGKWYSLGKTPNHRLWSTGWRCRRVGWIKRFCVLEYSEPVENLGPGVMIKGKPGERLSVFRAEDSGIK